ncbi:MAG: DUF4922 domain-containing protein [Chitinivibrionales bacterium]|nr:DUF4922 domain-containing protein [Chitinivibrionales bacterium]
MGGQLGQLPAARDRQSLRRVQGSPAHRRDRGTHTTGRMLMQPWESHLLELPAHMPVYQQVQVLLEQQRATWELFREGQAALDNLQIRTFGSVGERVVVQANPRRRISTDAKVDPASVAKRPCFLCPDALPPLERGIAFGEYVILPNPYPILRRHVTVAFRSHTPQRLAGRVADLLALTRALGPDMFVIYNGPRCGASAPDHQHFQACSCRGVPLFEQLPAAQSMEYLTPLTIAGRNLLYLSYADSARLEARIQAIVSSLETLLGEPGEPMVNLVARYHNGRYQVSVFPRARHRSACYFAEPAQRIAISPAAIEMAGVVVVADVDHFDRVNEAVVRSVYEEVTLGSELFNRLVEAVR